MIIVGLTGGIASGKTAVANMFKDAGYTVLDSDAFAKEVVLPYEPAWHEIKQTFGEKYFLPDGQLNRRLLAENIFGDAKARQKLNRIVHPRVLGMISQGLGESRLRGERFVLVDMPLLFEIGYDEKVDITVVVSVSQDIQISRLMQRDGLTLSEAQKRINAQLPLSIKAKRADCVIDNSGSLEDTSKHVSNLIAKLQNRASRSTC